MKQTLEIRPLKEDDLSSLNSLFIKVFKKERNPDYWKWKFFSNPHGDPVASVAVIGDEVVGFYGLLPRKLRMQGKPATAYQEVDLMVHPDHGKGGLFKKLGMASYERVQEKNDPFTFGFPNQTSLPLGRRILGWRAIKPIPLWTMLLNPAEALSGKLPRIPGAGLLVNMFFPVYHRIRLGSSATSEIIKVDKIPVDLDNLSTDSEAGFEFIRDREYLKWRYQEHPSEKYRIYASNENGQCSGLAIVGLGRNGRANLCEFLIDRNHPGIRSDLIQYIVRDCKKENCHTLRAWALADNTEAKVFAGLGFISRDALNYHVIRSFKSPEFNRRLWDPALWYLSAGDSDCV